MAEFSGRIAAGLKVKGFQKRYLFKRAFRELLPPEILRKKKHGFGIPVASWMKSDSHMRELLHDTLLSARAFKRGYFRRDFIDGSLPRARGRRMRHVLRRHTLDVLTLELWHRQVMDERIARVSA